jgi:hypothetical protein
MLEQEQAAAEVAEQEESDSQEDQDDAAAESEADAEDKGGKERFDEATAKAALKKKNNEAANLRKRLKELEPLAKKAKVLEDAQKSEGERLTEAKTASDKEASDAKQEAARLRVALKKGLTETQAKRLVGETEEELEADADDLLNSFKPAEEEAEEEESQEDAETKRRPKEKLRPGATPSAEEEETNPRKLAEGLPTYS